MSNEKVSVSDLVDFASAQCDGSPCEVRKGVFFRIQHAQIHRLVVETIRFDNGEAVDMNEISIAEPHIKQLVRRKIANLYDADLTTDEPGLREFLIEGGNCGSGCICYHRPDVRPEGSWRNVEIYPITWIELTSIVLQAPTDSNPDIVEASLPEYQRLMPREEGGLFRAETKNKFTATVKIDVEERLYRGRCSKVLRSG